MLQIFQISENHGASLEFTRLPQMPENPTANENGSLWINLEDPDPAELKYVADLFMIPDDFLLDSLDPAERPRAARAEKATLIIARASYHPESNPASQSDDAEKARAEQNYPTVPIGIVLTPSALVTVCRVPGLVSETLGNKAPGGGRPHTCIALRLLEKISTRFMKHLEKLDALSNQIEEAMQRSTRNEDLKRILQLEKTLVYFLNALKANALVLEKLLGTTGYIWEEAEREHLTDALIECRQAVEMGEIFTQIIANMSDIYASMISNNMNFVMKFLTAITLILMAPTIVVGLYGMNVPLPFQEEAWALPLIIMATLAICWLLWRYLLKKHWM